MALSPAERRRVRRTVPAATEALIERYGADAEAVVRSCLEHPGYSPRARYAFERILRDLPAIRARIARRGALAPYRSWRARWRRWMLRWRGSPVWLRRDGEDGADPFGF